MSVPTSSANPSNLSDPDIDAIYNDQKKHLHLFFGSFLILVVSLFIVLHMLMLKYLIVRVSRSPTTIGYRLMILMGLSDEVQLLIHFYTGILMICNVRVRPKPTEVAGAIMAAGWYLMMTTTFTVTIYRFIVILFPAHSHLVTNNRAFLYLLGGNLLIFTSVLVVYLIGLNTQYFTEYGWLYVKNRPLNPFFSNVDNYGTPAVTVVCLIMYIIIFAFVMRNKHENRESDIRWALQTFCFCLYTIFVSIQWTWIYDFVPATYIGLFLENFLWPLWNGSNAVFFFIFQKHGFCGKKRVPVLLPVANQKALDIKRSSLLPPSTPKEANETRVSI